MNHERVAELVRELLSEIGEDPTRNGLERTPVRVAESYDHLTSGYAVDPAELLRESRFPAEANNMVIVRDIEIYSLCEHHLLPFYGRCHIGYISRTTMLGLSHIARAADAYARRLQVQERLTAQIAQAVMDAANAVGVGVVLECRHLCMMMRGVAKQNSVMTTSSVLGSFHDDPRDRTEFLHLIGRTGGQT